jgi:Fe-S cluster assembly protein SufD
MTASLNQYLTEYETNVQRTRSSEPAWLTRSRDKALNTFLSLGFPTTRDEEWRFTSVAPISEADFVMAGDRATDSHTGSAFDRANVTPFRLPEDTSAEIVFLNGRYVPALSNLGVLPRGARVESLATSLATRTEVMEPYLSRLGSIEHKAFSALNAAFFADGAYVWIPAHTIVDKPIHALFISTAAPESRATMSHPRVVVVMGDDSQATMVESYAGPDGGRYLTNGVTDIVLGENSVLDHYKLQYESMQGYHIGATQLKAGRSANFTSHSVCLGGSIVRNDVVAVLDGEGVECTLNGLYFGDDRRLVDNHTTIDHAKPHCGSREMYKGILADRARGVFNGKIIVRPDAQKTDAKQTNRALLLSEDAQVNTKPQLEIFANDVKCTHGATVGQLDDEAVFYLRSRGLGDAEARHLLIRAFAADVLSRVPRESIRTGIENVLLRQLAHALPAPA